MADLFIRALTSALELADIISRLLKSIIVLKNIIVSCICYIKI